MKHSKSTIESFLTNVNESSQSTTSITKQQKSISNKSVMNLISMKDILFAVVFNTMSYKLLSGLILIYFIVNELIEY